MDKLKNILNTPSNQWSLSDALKIFETKFIDLIFQSQIIHRNNFEPNTIQVSTLLSIKTGGCPENCSYCPQSAHYNTNLTKEPLMDLQTVIEAAKKAKDNGSTRFCMGAAWRNPRDKDLELVCSMVKEVKKLGLETCVTLGMLKEHQAQMLKAAGLDFYNHNIDTSPDYYSNIITTRNFEERLETLELVGKSNIKVCCGGILGMGETNEDRVKMLLLLAKLNPVPDSIPINKLIKISGTPLAHSPDINSIDFVRTIALARIMMPKSYIRLSAGRESMSDELQALCFFAGANSIFYGEKLLTANNAIPDEDKALFEKLGLKKFNSPLQQIPVEII